MPKLTLEEVLALPSPLLDDNFDLKAVRFKDGTPCVMNDRTLKTLRGSLKKVFWEDAPNPFGINGGEVTLVFSDVLGDQHYLDAHHYLLNGLEDFTLQMFNEDGKAVRVVHFKGMVAHKSKQALDSSKGKEALRTNFYTYSSRREYAL